MLISMVRSKLKSFSRISRPMCEKLRLPLVVIEDASSSTPKITEARRIDRLVDLLRMNWLV